MLVISEVAEYTQGFRPVKGVYSKFLASVMTPERDIRNTPGAGGGSAFAEKMADGNFW